jgi:hypothetical protein
MSSKNLKRLVCTETGVIGYEDEMRGYLTEWPYSGYIEMIEKKTEEKTYFSRLLHIYQKGKGEEIGVFPNWMSYIPDKMAFSKSEGINAIGINLELLKIISDCFLYSTREKVLKMEFSSSSRSPIRITPQDNFNEFTVQEAILMPVEI